MIDIFTRFGNYEFNGGMAEAFKKFPGFIEPNDDHNHWVTKTGWATYWHRDELLTLMENSDSMAQVHMPELCLA